MDSNVSLTVGDLFLSYPHPIGDWFPVKERMRRQSEDGLYCSNWVHDTKKEEETMLEYLGYLK